MKVNQAFQTSGDWGHNFQQMLPDLMEDGIRVFIYAGDQDYICNWLGNKAWTLAMEWDGKEAFNAAPDRKWMVDGEVAGRVRTLKDRDDVFTFLQIHGAGHMVPK